MKKINDLVTTSKKTEQKSKRSSISFGSFKRAEEKQIAETKKRKHEEELARIAEEARVANEIRERNARIDREVREEAERAIKEEIKRKREEFITGSLSNAFGTKTKVDFTPVREEVIDKYIPQLKEPEKEERPTPFKEEPALNAELEEFKKKINEHLHTVGFMGSGGGGIGDIADAGDVDAGTALVNGKFLKYDSSSAKFVGSDSSGGTAADDISAGDAAVLLTTSSGDITIDAAANNSDIILKGTDGSADTTFLTIDGSAAGKATFNNEIVSGAVITSGAGLVIADTGNIGSASDTDAIAIAANGVVTFSQVPVFPNDTVETADIQADAITGAKIADDAINSEHYTDGSIDTAHIADANVTLAKIANAAANTVIVRDANSSGVLSAKAVTNTQILIGDGTGFTAAALSGDVTMTNAGAVTIANTAVETAMIAADAITSAKIADDAIDSEHYTDGSIDTAHIAAAQVTGPKLGGGVIGAVGFSATTFDLGTNASGTETLDEANGNFQKGVNGGAHTLAPQSNDSTIVVQYTNNASAGTITVSGYDTVTGDSLTTTNGHDFLMFSTVIGSFQNLNVVALQ